MYLKVRSVLAKARLETFVSSDAVAWKRVSYCPACLERGWNSLDSHSLIEYSPIQPHQPNRNRFVCLQRTTCKPARFLYMSVGDTHDIVRLAEFIIESGSIFQGLFKTMKAILPGPYTFILPSTNEVTDFDYSVSTLKCNNW